MHAGKPQAQALAIAYREKREGNDCTLAAGGYVSGRDYRAALDMEKAAADAEQPPKWTPESARQQKGGTFGT